ncbi:MAG: hypothetical protein ACRD03_09040 [Acidimicrobiales bacterium]
MPDRRRSATQHDRTDLRIHGDPNPHHPRREHHRVLQEHHPGRLDPRSHCPPRLASQVQGRFRGAAGDRGCTTRQTFDDNTTEFAVSAEGQLGIELGANISVDTIRRTSTGAEYWDGIRWVARTECNPS